jgi:hypothetical protein
MRIACWMPEAKNTHSECVILIVLPLQQWLYERVSMLLLYVLYLLDAFLEIRSSEQISLAQCAEMRVQSVFYSNFCPLKKQKKNLWLILVTCFSITYSIEGATSKFPKFF